MPKALRSIIAAAAGLAVAICILFSSRDAHALGPLDVEAAAKFGVGTNPGSGTINPLGLGLGGRAGVSIFGIYGGLNLVDYFGGKDTTSDATAGVSEHALMYGVELGYQLKISIITIRPQIGLGNIIFYSSQDTSLVPQGGATIPNSSESHFYLEPGATGLVAFGNIIAGVDLGALVITGVDDGTGSSKIETAFTVHAQAGVRF